MVLAQQEDVELVNAKGDGVKRAGGDVTTTKPRHKTTCTFLPYLRDSVTINRKTDHSLAMCLEKTRMRIHEW